jgi:hypothetical protein
MIAADRAKPAAASLYRFNRIVLKRHTARLCATSSPKTSNSFSWGRASLHIAQFHFQKNAPPVTNVIIR